MPSEITMPQQSDTMTEGTVVKWLKKEGDKVKEGDVIAEIETDKATMEMEAFEAGTIAVIKAPEGTKVPVGELIAVLATKNESVDDVKKKFASGNGSAATAAEPSQPRTQIREEQREQQGRGPATSAGPPEPVTAKRREEEEGGGVPGGPL